MTGEYYNYPNNNNNKQDLELLDYDEEHEQEQPRLQNSPIEPPKLTRELPNDPNSPDYGRQLYSDPNDPNSEYINGQQYRGQYIYEEYSEYIDYNPDNYQDNYNAYLDTSSPVVNDYYNNGPQLRPQLTRELMTSPDEPEEADLQKVNNKKNNKKNKKRKRQRRQIDFEDFEHSHDNSHIWTFDSENPKNLIRSVNVAASPLTFNQIPKITLKLAGGQDSIPGSWAWVAQIKRKVKNNVENEFICAGTLIHVRWVLTAAQCIHEHEEPFDFYETKDMFVVVGTNQLYGSRLTNENHQEIDIVEMHEHKNYRVEVTPRNDIALLELSKEVILSTHVQPACLPSGRYPNEFNTIAEPRADDWCWFVGWGFTNPIPASMQSRPNDLSRTLQQARQYPLHSSLCKGLLKEWNPDMEQHLCAVGGEEQPNFGHPCEGDGGGPLICQRKKNKSSKPGQPENMWFIAGVEIGQSALCGFGEWKKIPAIFSRVTVFENWINTIIEGKYNLTKMHDA